MASESTYANYKQLPGKRMAAGALITKGSSVLIVKPSYKSELEIPGGIIEIDESPRAALIRELKEELGLELEPGRLLVLEYQSGNDNKTESIMFVFEVRITREQETRIKLNSDELVSWRYHDFSELKGILVPRLARRLEIAREALLGGSTAYAENGKVFHDQ